MYLTFTIFSLQTMWNWPQIRQGSSRPGDHVTFICRVFRSSALEWRNPLITQLTSYAALDTPPMILNRDPLTVSLISVSGIPLNANFTSTLQVTASRMINYCSHCLSTTASKVDNFTVAGDYCIYDIQYLWHHYVFNYGDKYIWYA